MKKPFHSLLIVLLAVITMMSGCGSGGGSAGNNNSSSSSFIYGVASKGPIIEGFVVVYPLSSGGESGKVLDTTFTGDNGSYIVDIRGYTGNILVEVKKGHYTDEATNGTYDNDVLRAAVTRVNGSVSVMVTPFTEIAVKKALDDGGLTEANIDNANAFVGTVAGGVDIINTAPANVLDADNVANSNTEEISYGLSLASISEMVKNNFAANVPDAINKINDAISDKTLAAQGENLKNSLQAFLNNPNNQSGVTKFFQTDIDESFNLLSNTSLEKDSSDINQVFKILEDLYAVQSPSDTDIKGWFAANIADDYLHDGRVKADEADIWTGQGGLTQGVSLFAVLFSPMDTTDTGFEKGYLIRVSFSGSNGTGNIISSMVYDSDSGKWLWYGNRDWGVGLSNFMPRAEMIVEGNGQDVSYSNGFDMLIWDYNKSAYSHGIRSAVISGLGLPADGLILEHYYPQSYFSLYNSSTGYRYPLTDDIVADIPDNAEYTIRFYSGTADQLSLSSLPAAVRTETKTFTKKPYLSTEINPSIFPALTSDSHDLTTLNIGGQVNIGWTNPADTTVNLASLNWTDANGDSKSALEYPDTNSVTFDTSKLADLSAQLYLRGQDIYGRGVSLKWHYWKQPSGSENDVTAINDIFHSLEQIYSTPKSSEELSASLEEWFNTNVSGDYLHDGKDFAKEREEWTLLGSQYQGLSVSAVLLEPGQDENWGTYQLGYRVMLYLSVPGGSGSIRTSMIYDSDKGKWQWYGNQEWGLGLSGFLPWAEETISSLTDLTFDTGFEVIIWDSNLAAYNKGGVRSAIITGPGLSDGIKLKHHYAESNNPEKAYLSPVNSSGSEVFNHSLPDDQIKEINDNSVYTINFYDVDVTAEGIKPQDYTPVKSLTRTIAKGPVLKADLEANPATYFPEITAPVSHELSAANIGGSLDASWTNPSSQMTVNFVSLGWLDSNGMQYKYAYPDYSAGSQEGHVTLTTEGSTVMLLANLYLRGEDSYGRRFSVTWQFSDSSSFTSPTP